MNSFMTYLVEHLNLVLYAIAGLLTLLEVIFRWVTPSVRKNPAYAGLVETVDSFWVAIVVALSLKAVLVQPFTIPSGSMENTLKINDYILVKKYEYGYSLLNMTPRYLDFKKPQRRDVVVFVYPGDHSKDYIKRCIGIPGDVIEIKDKDLFVNGQKQDEPYVKHSSPDIVSISDYNMGWRDNYGPVTVEAGHYFMMGDNRDNSADSRAWGQLDEKLIKGKAWAIYWHSIGTASFIVLLALGWAGLTALYLILIWAGDRLFMRRKPELGPDSGTEAETKKELSPYRNPLLTIVVSIIVAGSLLAFVGSSPFNTNCKNLKERIFTKIK